MNDRHRYIIGGLYLCHGLVRSCIALMILSAGTNLTFSAAMITMGFAVPSLMGGYNLLVNNESAHRIMPLAAAINLISLPEGTVLALYYCWFWKYECGSPNPFKPVNNSGLSSTGQQ